MDPRGSIWLENVIKGDSVIPVHIRLEVLESFKNHCDIGQGVCVHVETDLKHLFSYSMVLQRATRRSWYYWLTL